ncbi:MAG: hypothetical protein ABEK04_02515 [Candidatus Nanohalobium sp.]
MDLEQDYIVYALEVSLTFLAISSAYLIDVSRPVTFLFLLPTTILFGYTAYVSRYDFKTHSVLSLLGLAFTMLGGVVAAVAVFASIGNVLVSVFSSGEGFRNFYGATSLPLLFTGLIMGASVYGLAMADPAVANRIQDEVAGYAGGQAEMIVNRSNMLEAQKDGQARLINATSATTFTITRGKVLKEMGDSKLSHKEYTKLTEAFESANKIVEKNVVNKTTQRIDSTSIDISKRVSDLVHNSLKGKAFLLLVPVIAFGIYGVHPIVGLFTAMWASLFSAVSSREEEDSDSKELDSDFEL